jgi:hypothetical protein
MAALRDFALALTFIFALALNIFRALALIAQNCARANVLKKFRKIALKFKFFICISHKKLSDQILQTTLDLALHQLKFLHVPQSRRNVDFFLNS